MVVRATVRLTSIHHPQIEGKFTATPGGLTVFLVAGTSSVIRVVLTPRNGWMGSGCAADAQRARSITTAMVEEIKDRYANDAVSKSPQNPADAPPPPPARILLEIGAKSSKSPQFCLTCLSFVGTNIILDPPPNVRRYTLPYSNI